MNLREALTFKTNPLHSVLGTNKDVFFIQTDLNMDEQVVQLRWGLEGQEIRKLLFKRRISLPTKGPAGYGVSNHFSSSSLPLSHSHSSLHHFSSL